MKSFSGFPPGKVPIAGVPEQAFTELIPAIDDLAELKLTLHAIWRLGQQRGKVRYLRRADLLADQVLLSGLGDSPIESLDAALTRAIERGTLLKATPPSADIGEEIYFANTPKGRAASAAISRGEWPDELEAAARPNVFTLYEENIGLLTPMIAEELRDAEQTYPQAWIEEAFREAVSLNKRSWKYIHAILKRWHTEGKEDDEGHTSEESKRKRYITGKYGDYIEH